MLVLYYLLATTASAHGLGGGEGQAGDVFKVESLQHGLR